MEADKTTKSFPTYQTSKAVGKHSAILLAYILHIKKATEERSYDRVLFFHTLKTSFVKNTQNQRAKLNIYKK